TIKTPNKKIKTAKIKIERWYLLSGCNNITPNKNPAKIASPPNVGIGEICILRTFGLSNKFVFFTIRISNGEHTAATKIQSIESSIIFNIVHLKSSLHYLHNIIKSSHYNLSQYTIHIINLFHTFI